MFGTGRPARNVDDPRSGQEAVRHHHREVGHGQGTLVVGHDQVEASRSGRQRRVDGAALDALDEHPLTCCARAGVVGAACVRLVAPTAAQPTALRLALRGSSKGREWAIAGP